jgi:hypothetical protein
MTRGMTRVIAVPFHDGRLEFDRRRGPGELLAAAGIEDAETIPPPDPVAPEAARVFAIAAELAGRVRAARGAGAAPVVVAATATRASARSAAAARRDWASSGSTRTPTSTRRTTACPVRSTPWASPC